MGFCLTESMNVFSLDLTSMFLEDIEYLRVHFHVKYGKFFFHWKRGVVVKDFIITSYSKYR